MISQPLKKRSRAPESEPVMFEPLTPQPAYRRLSTVIEQKILKRTLRQGDTLPTETELARQFAVNRSTVREALRRLESAGLVGRIAGGKRLVVTRPAAAETASRVSHALVLDDVTLIELSEAMLVIAPRVAALAARNSTAADVQRLNGLIERVETARGADATVARVVDFFGALAELSGNRVLMLAMQPVTQLLAPSLRRMIDRVTQSRSRIVVAQRCIVEALRANDTGEAESWMTRHVQDFRRGYELAGIALDTRAAMASPDA
jgi:DNA-binding FadR family transcriptional regulator